MWSLGLLAAAAVAAGSAATSDLLLKSPFTTLGSQWTLMGDAAAGNDVVNLAVKPSQQGAVWSRERLPWEEWTIEARLHTFPSSGGPDRSGFAVWLTSEPQNVGSVHGGSDSWDGLAVMLDSLGPGGVGEVRGHLNDGSYRFEASASPGSDAMSLCRLSYREATSPITIRIGYGQGVFAVDVNRQRCFRSNEIALQPGFVGISADTAQSSDTLVLEFISASQGLAPDMLEYFSADQIGAPKIDNQISAHEAAADSIVGSHGSAAPLVREIDPEVINKPVLSAIEALSDLVGHLSGSIGTGSNLPKGSESSLISIDQRLTKIERLLIEAGDVLAKLPEALGSPASVAADPELTREISELRAQLGVVTSSVESNQRANMDSYSQEASTSMTTPGLGTFMAAMVAVQIALFIAYQAWERRQRRHQKLL